MLTMWKAFVRLMNAFAALKMFCEGPDISETLHLLA